MKETTYFKLFETLKSLNNLIAPLVIKLDFELAASLAARESFNNVKISTCEFYLGQSLFRRIQLDGLQNLYKCDLKVKNSFKCLMVYFRDFPKSQIPEISKKLKNFNPSFQQQDAPVFT
jgi:hypothetical protein